MEILLVSALASLIVGGLTYTIGKRNAKTNEFKEIVSAYNQFSDDVRKELALAKIQIAELRIEVRECHEIINSLRAELAQYEETK